MGTKFFVIQYQAACKNHISVCKKEDVTNEIQWILAAYDIVDQIEIFPYRFDKDFVVAIEKISKAINETLEYENTGGIYWRILENMNEIKEEIKRKAYELFTKNMEGFEKEVHEAYIRDFI